MELVEKKTCQFLIRLNDEELHRILNCIQFILNMKVDSSIDRDIFLDKYRLLKVEMREFLNAGDFSLINPSQPQCLKLKEARLRAIGNFYGKAHQQNKFIEEIRECMVEATINHNHTKFLEEFADVRVAAATLFNELTPEEKDFVTHTENFKILRQIFRMKEEAEKDREAKN